jgi:acetyl-CoA synthetase
MMDRFNWALDYFDHLPAGDLALWCESALIEHEAVAEVAVIPSPDSQRVVVTKAFLTLAAGHQPDRATARDMFARTRDRLAPYK